MKILDDKFLENQIFGENVEKDSIKSEKIENDKFSYDDEMDEKEDICEEKQIFNIIDTNIVCDGRGFQNIFNDEDRDTHPNFSKYISNNFKIIDTNDCLNELEKKGCAIYLTTDGELMLRISEDKEFKVVTEERASRVISNLLKKPIVIGKGTKGKSPDIPFSDLMLVSDIDFETESMAEFYKDGTTYKRNKFIPIEEMKLDKNTPYKKPVTILKLLNHLVNYDEFRLHYLINWIAHMFVFLKKSQVAVVLRGNQGSGKGLLFKIISMLFGKKYCFIIGNKTLKSQFLGSVFEFKLFMNINEMSHDLKSNKENKNAVKEFVTDDDFAGEKKYENISKPIKLCSQILITSNEAYILEIETEDRRFTVMSTSDNISGENYKFFGFGEFKSFMKQMILEIDDFALYLKNYPIDVNLANKALDTQEKRALIKGTNNRFKLLVNGLLNKNIAYLEPLKTTNPETYSYILSSFKKGRIYQRDIVPAYIAANPSDFNITTQTLLDKLEIYEPTKFSRELRKKSGDWYFNL